MTDRLLIVTMLFLLALQPLVTEAADWRSVVDLKGSWSFTVGDDIRWTEPETDIGDWDKIQVPRDWESHYPGYNGHAWYRKTFDYSPLSTHNTLTLFLGFIDDVDEVYINGQKVGSTGQFPPFFKTAYNIERRYLVPVDLLKPNNNVICVRVYDVTSINFY